MPEITTRLRPPRYSTLTRPASPQTGEMYFDTTTNILMFWDGAAWVSTKSAAGTIYDSDPVGTIITFAGTVIPTNWVLCDGRTLDNTLYPDLFAAIGYKYGGSGSNFQLPDLRSKFIYGVAQTDLSDLGVTGGVSTVVLDLTQIPAHAHAGSAVVAAGNFGGSTSSAGDHFHTPTVPTDVFMLNTGGQTINFGSSGNLDERCTSLDNQTNTTGAHTHTVNLNSHGHGLTIASEGGGASHENLPPYIRLNQIIKITGAQINAGGALQGATGATGAKGDPGPWRGAWSAATAYAVGDSVSYATGGTTASYRRKVAGTTAGAPNTDTTNWELIASGGSIGANGSAGFTPSGRAESAAYAITADTNARFLNPALTVQFDTGIGGNCFTVNQGRFTAPIAGKYLVGCYIREMAAGNASIGVIKNSTTVLRRVTQNMVVGADGTKPGIECWDVYDLAAGDNLMIHGWSGGGGSTNIIGFMAVRQDASSSSTGIALVSTLPASPTDGMEIYFLADAANGIVWHLRYRSAAPGSFKWEFVGGPPLIHQIDTDEGGTTTSYTDFATVGPQLTIPLAGDYIAEYGALSYQTVASVDNYYTPKLGAAAANDVDTALATFTGTSKLVTHQRTRRFNALAASALIKMQFKMSAANAGSFRNRWLTLTPVRVG
jgi:microcystin-dependent protein